MVINGNRGHIGHHGNIREVVQKRGPFSRPLLLRGPWTPPLTRTSRDMSTLGHIILSTVFSSFSFIFSVFFSSVKSVSGPNASTATLKYGPNILIAHGTTKGGGVAGPLSSKRLLKGTFFLDPFPY